MTKMRGEIFEQPKMLAGIEKENESTLKALVEELKGRNITHAVFAARGTSDNAGIYGQYLFGIYKGAVAALAVPSCITQYNGKLDFGNDLVIGISQSGKAEDVLAVIEQAKSLGAVTVAITNDKSSPLANSAKYHLYCNAGVEESVAATKTFTAQMYLIALLTAYWSGNKELLQSLRTLPQIMDKMLKDLPAEIERYVDRFRYINEGFILSRGICYPIALEASLKMQETCYIKMKGYAISDFYHGPMAQIERDLPIIIFAPKGAVFDDTKEITEKIIGLGTEVLVVTDDSELSSGMPLSVLLPDTGGEPCAAFLFAVFAQCFSEMLSVSKGLNPDKPRLLNKITITK